MKYYKVKKNDGYLGLIKNELYTTSEMKKKQFLTPEPTYGFDKDGKKYNATERFINANFEIINVKKSQVHTLFGARFLNKL